MQTLLSGNWRYNPQDNPDFALPGTHDSDWPQMAVPGNWFLSGLDHHGVVWFRHRFDYQVGRAQYARLCFDGVDYFADVYLNGTLLGHHTGYFEPFSFDVSGILKAGRNLLAVRVSSPYEQPGLDGWHLRKRLVKGVLNHHDCRPGGGWEPSGQSYNTGGIWNRVYLEEHGPLTIEAALLRADLEADPPVLQVEVRVRNRGPRRDARLEVRCAPENFAGKAFTGEFPREIPEGESIRTVRLPVPGVARWQPWDRGFPHLYRVTLDLDGVGREETFGFRTVRMDKGYRFFVNGEPYFLRGSNYIASQWLAETLFPEVEENAAHPFGKREAGRGGRSWFEEDVRLAVGANLNILRVHAHVLPPEFHLACDRAGLLVWQDFPLQWGYSDEPAFQEEAVRQIGAMVTLLYNHPSIVLWCCHNESPWDAPWMAGAVGGLYDPAHNRDLDARLEETVRRLDPSRVVHRNSGTGDGHAYPGWYFSDYTLFRDLPGAPLVTEYGAQALPARASLLRTFARLGPDAGYAELMRFKGFLRERSSYKALPPGFMRVMSRLINKGEKSVALKPLIGWIKSWGLKTETSHYKRLPKPEDVPADLRPAYETWQAWRFHDFQPPETFEEGRIDTGNSLDDFIRSSQDYQARLLQYSTESYRRARGRVTGLFQFDFSDPWPAITWSVVDYWRQPKAGYEALRRAMQPVLPCLVLPEKLTAGKDLQARFYVVNDTPLAYRHALVSLAIDDGKRIQSFGNWFIDVAPDRVMGPARIPLKSEAGSYHLRVQLFRFNDNSPEEILLAENEYHFEVG